MTRLKSASVLLILLIFTVSCIKDIDFDQIDDLTFATPLSVSFVYVEVDQSVFLDANNQEISHVIDESDIQIIDFLSHAEDNVITIVTYLTNTIDREFVIEYEFYDAQNQLVMISDSMLIQPNSTNLTYEMSYTYAQLENVTRVRTSIRMLPGVPLRPLLDRNLSIDSTINMNYEY